MISNQRKKIIDIPFCTVVQTLSRNDVLDAGMSPAMSVEKRPLSDDYTTSQRSKLVPPRMPGAGNFGKGQQRFTKYIPVGQASSKPMG